MAIMKLDVGKDNRITIAKTEVRVKLSPNDKEEILERVLVLAEEADRKIRKYLTSSLRGKVIKVGSSKYYSVIFYAKIRKRRRAVFYISEEENSFERLKWFGEYIDKEVL